MTRYTRIFLAWCIHLFTASGAAFGLGATYAIFQHKYKVAFVFMAVTIVIDAVDGFFARLVNVKEAVPSIDGALLDNIVDYFNYAIVPAFFLVSTSQLLPHGWHFVCAVIIILAASYQFTQKDAKTEDHFFKGFPSYWNIAVFYFFFWEMHSVVNAAFIVLFGILSFVPVKCLYPSRLDYLTRSYFLRVLMVLATLVWGVATVGLLWIYPKSNPILVFLSMGYVALYICVSLYRTWVPLKL